MKKSVSNKNEDTIINMFLMIMLTSREVDIKTDFITVRNKRKLL